MQARLLAIYAAYAEYILSLVPLQIEDEYLKVVIHLVDGSNLRVTEEWEAGVLVSYSYYWLTDDNRLKIGWDNATASCANWRAFRITNMSGSRPTADSSDETSLEDVMQVIVPQLAPSGA